MDDLKKEIKILKALVRAQARMNQAYRAGDLTVPESVFNAFSAAMRFYGVSGVSEIR